MVGDRFIEDESLTSGCIRRTRKRVLEAVHECICGEAVAELLKEDSTVTIKCAYRACETLWVCAPNPVIHLLIFR